MKRLLRTDEEGSLPLAPAIGFSFAGQVTYLLSQLAVLSSLTWLRGPAAVGEFGLAMALSTPFFTFVSMGGKSSQSSDVKKRYSFAEYSGLISCLAVVGVIGSVAAGIVFAKTSSALLIVFIVALMKAAGAISSLSYGAFQQAGRPDKITVSLALRGIFTVPIFVSLLYLGFPVGIAFCAQLAVWTTVAFFWDYPNASRIAAGRVVGPQFNWKRLFALGRETAPYGASMSLEALTNSLPRIAIERALGLSEVGILTIVTYFQQAGSVLTSALTQPLVNRFARLRESNDHQTLRRTQFALFALVTGCSVAGVAFVAIAGEWLLKLLFGAALEDAAPLLMLIALALSAKLFAAIPQSLLHAERRYSAFFFRELATVIVCAVMLLAFVPGFGLMGAGYAILGCAVFRLVAMLMVTSVAKEAARSEAGAPSPAQPRA